MGALASERGSHFSMITKSWGIRSFPNSLFYALLQKYPNRQQVGKYNDKTHYRPGQRTAGRRTENC